MACAPKAIPPPPKPANIAVVLGAGAVKGFAHIGVLKILESQKIPIHMVVGTSVGSLVGSLYAYGYDAYKLQMIAYALERDDLIDITLPDNGFVKGEKLENYVNRMVRDTPIEKFRIPFHAVATNIQTGEEMVFGTGNAGMAVRASCSIPGIFKPARISGKTYADGGIVSPLAVDVARRYGADVVIAVNISTSPDATIPQGTVETILQSVDIMYAKIAALQIPRADVVIKPIVSHIGSTDFTRKHEAILEGEKAALAAMPAIQAILSKLRQEGRLP
jgi:NTE family protein